MFLCYLRWKICSATQQERFKSLAFSAGRARGLVMIKVCLLKQLLAKLATDLQTCRIQESYCHCPRHSCEPRRTFEQTQLAYFFLSWRNTLLGMTQSCHFFAHIC